MSDNDPMLREIDNTITAVDRLVAEGHEILTRSQEALADVGARPETLAALKTMLSPEQLAEAEREKQALADELERDAPRVTARRQTRVNPARTMI